MKCLLVGNYGAGNLGDDLLKQYFLETFPEISWAVVSANPTSGEFPRLPAGIRSFLSFRWRKTLRAMRETDAVVFGGGTLFTDIESIRACTLWAKHAEAAYRSQKPVLLAFQGLGPFASKRGETIAKEIFSRASFISVRDPESHALLQTWGWTREIVQTFDPVFSLLRRGNFSLRAKNVLTIIPRMNSTETFCTRAEELSRDRAFESVRIVSLQPDDSAEMQHIRSLAARLAQNPETISVRSLQELGNAVLGSSLVLTQRYHGAISAAALGCRLEIMPQAAGDKLERLQQFITEQSPLALEVLVERGEAALRERLRALASGK